MNTNFMVHTSNGSIFEIDLDKPNWAQLIDDKTWVGPHYSFFSEIIKGRSYECPLLDIEEGDIVYNPFAGFGSALIACDQLGARCFCIEKSPKKCDFIIRRWQQFTGDKAYKEE